MVKKKLRLSVIVAVIVLILGVGIWSALVAIGKNDAKRAREYEQRALPIGLARAKEECLKEGLSESTCNSMTSNVTTAECSNGYNCWFVHTFMSDGSRFATVTVERVSPDATQLRATNYLRNKVIDKN